MTKYLMPSFLLFPFWHAENSYARLPNIERLEQCSAKFTRPTLPGYNIVAASSSHLLALLGFRHAPSSRPAPGFYHFPLSVNFCVYVRMCMAVLILGVRTLHLIFA
jgi:hypothetical protein